MLKYVNVKMVCIGELTTALLKVYVLDVKYRNMSQSSLSISLYFVLAHL